MNGTRIKNARESLKFFLKSLPPDSLFNVVSFGNKHSKLFGKSAICSNEIVQFALQKI